MVLLYLLLLLLCGGVYALLKWRANKLEKKYARVAKETDDLVRQPLYKGGNSGRPDPCLAARRQLELGLLVQKRDKVEARYTKWQGRADCLGALLQWLRTCKGKMVPYLMGVVDVVIGMLLIHYLTAGDYVNLDGLLQAIVAFVNK